MSYDALAGGGDAGSPGGSKTGLFAMGGDGWNAKDMGAAFGAIGGVFAGVENAEAYYGEARRYGEAENSFENQAAAAQNIGDVEQFQLKRKVALSESATRAGAAGNGLQEAGSVADILRSSAMQGKMAEQNLTYSTELKVDQYNEQAHAAEMMGQAAKSAAVGSIVGGVFKGLTGAAQIAAMF